MATAALARLRPGRPVRRAALVTAALLAGCQGGEEPGDPERPPPVAKVELRTASHVAVPDRDASPPEATIVLRGAGGAPLAHASQPPAGHHPAPVELDRPRLRSTAVGRDSNGGVARVRVSIKEWILCRHRDGRDERLRTRYFPPSQIERIRSSPGARLPTELTRTLPLALAGDRCGHADPVAVRGELWGEAINGSGLEAVTPHLRFTWQRITPGP
jgi:hypothetical protein